MNHPPTPRRSLTRRRLLHTTGGGIAGAGATLLAGCDRAATAPARGEPAPGRVYRMGWLAPGDLARTVTPDRWLSPPAPSVQRFMDRLAELGYEEGRNLEISFRRAPVGAQLDAEAADLAGLGLDVIIVLATAHALRAAWQAPGATPIVFCASTVDPVADGYAQSLARPGGKVTGVMFQGPFALAGPKLVEVFKDVVPTLTRLGVLLDVGPGVVIPPDEVRAWLEPAALAMGIEPVIVEVRELDELNGAFAAMARAGAQGVFLFMRVEWTALTLAPRIVGEALRYRLAVVGPQTGWPAAGGALVAYGADVGAVWSRTADYVDKVLRGTPPGEIPIELPSKYNLIINLKTADLLGLTIPPAVLARATEVIQ